MKLGILNESSSFSIRSIENKLFKANVNLGRRGATSLTIFDIKGQNRCLTVKNSPLKSIETRFLI